MKPLYVKANLGSRIPLDIEKLKGWTLVDPFFSTLDSTQFGTLDVRFPEIQFSPLTAHEFLDFVLAKRHSLDEIRIDCPAGGLIAKNSDFPGLLKKMSNALKPEGKIEIMTDIISKEAKVPAEPKEIYSILSGRDPGELCDSEREKLLSLSKPIPCVDILNALKQEGFITAVRPACKNEISRSETAKRKDANKKELFVIIARKS